MPSGMEWKVVQSVISHSMHETLFRSLADIFKKERWCHTGKGCLG